MQTKNHGNLQNQNSDVRGYPIIRLNSEKSNVTNCFYNSSVLYMGNYETNSEGKTAAEMKDNSFLTLLGDAFKADVYSLNAGFPILQWEQPNPVDEVISKDKRN